MDHLVVGDRLGRIVASSAAAMGGIVIAAIFCATWLRIKGDQRDYSLGVTGSAKRTLNDRAPGMALDH